MTPCHAKQCSEQMPSGIPLCLDHWHMLPKDMTKKLLKPKSSEAYYEALEQAIGFIAHREGK